MERIHTNEVPAGLIETMMQTGNYVNSTGLERSLLELLKIRVSQINGCSYCLDMHYKDALNAGESVERVVMTGAWRETPFFTAKERAVLDFAEKLTRIATEDLKENIHDKLTPFFSPAEIANLSLAVAQINSWNRILKSFGTPAGNYRVKQHVASNN